MLSLLREATGSEHQSSEGAQDIQEVARPAGYLCEAEPPSQTLQLSEGGSTSQLLSFPEDDDSGDDIDTDSRWETGTAGTTETVNSMGAGAAAEFGYVEGAMKGNYPYRTCSTLRAVIKRSRPLREAAGDSRAGSKRFRRVMKEIIVRESAYILWFALRAVLMELSRLKISLLRLAAGSTLWASTQLPRHHSSTTFPHGSEKMLLRR
ncbi:hypothetical protein AGABI1DRAFT_96294 [Agaricus bisporus var. burnettii JB137-S8]|uniref:Uncharacterized protein n=1 Tax=Agaricus bisporus var. burnettii (strain JB137-S8 / ATCC MYA-4627 / FGSC 10392) TaxID=597362 RepID=K5WRJ5_AGABU|nr:uncharacterized protein AGABI1DRAFT_96294 [Agaricus bisporus var. burnettii JB137-S8]EKM73373.1 hypothetical protein AGABI1DRAFT_96294 [Agaricus bisporus var. burnettii JB137-S8]